MKVTINNKCSKSFATATEKLVQNIKTAISRYKYTADEIVISLEEINRNIGVRANFFIDSNVCIDVYFEGKTINESIDKISTKIDAIVTEHKSKRSDKRLERKRIEKNSKFQRKYKAMSFKEQRALKKNADPQTININTEQIDAEDIIKYEEALRKSKKAS